MRNATVCPCFPAPRRLATGDWLTDRSIPLVLQILIVLFFIGFLIFYEIQGTQFCPQCKYLQVQNSF